MARNGRVDALCVGERKGTAKRAVARAELRADHGLVGDAHAGPWHRQLSLLGAEDVEAFRAGGRLDLQPGAFAENFLLSGLALDGLGLGSRIRLGAEALVEVTQLGKTCHDRCAIYHAMGDCIMPRLGIFGRVLAGGAVAVGDAAAVERRVARETPQAVVLTLSDRCSRGEAEDTAGPAIADLLARGLAAHVYRTEILPDDRATLAARLRHYCDGHSIDLVVAVGGTGFSPRDTTPEAVRDVVGRLTPGLDEAMRAASARKTKHAWLSRAVSGIRERTLILSVPGSRAGATENLEALLELLPHAIEKLRGDPSDCGRPSPR